MIHHRPGNHTHVLCTSPKPSACRREEGRRGCPTYMMKRKGFVLALVLAVFVLLAGFAVAEGDPVVTSMELTPSKLTGPGKVNVTITVSNSGNEDLKDPVVLYDPAAQVVSDFGNNGAVTLKAGESKTWTGTYDVNQRTLDNGVVTYFVKYTLYNDNGKAVEQSQSIRAKIELQTAEADIEVKRTISPTIAREEQEIVVRYDIMNTGTVNLVDVTIEETKDVYSKKQTIPLLKPGQTAEIKYPVTMGKKDLVSGATITYKSEKDSKVQTYTVEKQTIKYGEPALEAELSASAKGVVQNGLITLTLKLKNTGSVDYSDIRVTDAALGDVFTNQELKAGKTLELTKEVTVPESTEYQFTVNATDATGSETAISTNALPVTAVSPEDALELTVVATPDRTEVFEQPGRVRFTLTITNDSRVEAKNVQVAHGETKLYTFNSIPAGESRTLSRDFALSMAGKYRFTVTATDPLESTLSFDSNETQIAFSVPTPAPATPTPVPAPTPEPTFAAATIPPITSAAIGAVPKLVQKILLPVLIVLGVLIVASGVLLLIATKRRHDQKKASEAAVDQLERAKRRDYVTPAEEQEEEAVEEQKASEPVAIDSTALDNVDEEEYELPHMKYARSARPAEPVAEEQYMPEDNACYDDQAGQDAYDDSAYYGEGEYESYESYDDGYYAEDENVQWDEEAVYEDEEPQPEDNGSAAAYDDSMFRRPQEESEEPRAASRRTRRSRSVDA